MAYGSIEGQTPQVDLSDYVTTSQLNSTLNSYVTQTNLNSQLSSYVTTSALNSRLSSYATQSWVNNKGYATQSYVNNAVSNIIINGNIFCDLVGGVGVTSNTTYTKTFTYTSNINTVQVVYIISSLYFGATGQYVNGSAVGVIERTSSNSIYSSYYYVGSSGGHYEPDGSLLSISVSGRNLTVQIYADMNAPKNGILYFCKCS